MYVRYEGDDWALLGLACDNAIHLESSDAVHAQVLGALQARFDWLDEGEISEVPSVLGTKIVQDLEAGTVTLSQEGYVDSLAEEWAEHLSKRKISTPASKELEEKVAEAARTKGEARSPALVKRYQRLVGALLFKSVVTGPDIAWAVAMLSRAMAWPTEALMGEAFRCLSYVVQHKSLPIKFSRDTYFSARTGTTVFRRDADQGGLSGVFAIDDGHSDADYAAGPSVSGWAWRAAGAAFLYGSKRQSETMLCSASSELVAGSVAATDGLHARGLKDEMGFPESGPTVAPLDRQQGDRRAGSRPDLLQQDQARGAAPPLPARVRRVRRARRGAHLDRLQHRGPLHEGARAEEVPPVPRCGDEPPDRDAARLRGFGPRRWAGVDRGKG